jgi:hypothetical protein
VDIGNQQRVIIVEPEPDQVLAPEPVPAAIGQAESGLVGEWPRPMAIEAELTPTG